MRSTMTDEVGMRRAKAIAGGRQAIETVRALGVEMKIVGSLAKDTFGQYSDVDFLVLSCPREHKYAIEGRIEDHLGTIPFDVLYLDEVSDRRRGALVAEMIDASRLR